MICTELKLAFFAVVLALAGCAGNGEGLDANGRPDSGTPGGPLTAEFASIQAHVFTPICTTCHAGANAPQGLRLDEANSYNLLVGVASVEVPSLLRVDPGNPDDSYLIQKLEGNAASGAQMPFGGPPLPQSTIDVIRQWITDGAQAPVAVASAAPFDLVTAAPADGDWLIESPTQIVLGFTQELDATRADSTAVRLERVADGGEPAGNDDGSSGNAATQIAASIVVPLANPRALILTPRQSLADGRYRIVLDDRNGAGLSDLAGRRLPMAAANDHGERVVATFEVERLE